MFFRSRKLRPDSSEVTDEQQLRSELNDSRDGDSRPENVREEEAAILSPQQDDGEKLRAKFREEEAAILSRFWAGVDGESEEEQAAILSELHL